MRDSPNLIAWKLIDWFIPETNQSSNVSYVQLHVVEKPICDCMCKNYTLLRGRYIAKCAENPSRIGIPLKSTRKLTRAKNVLSVIYVHIQVLARGIWNRTCLYTPTKNHSNVTHAIKVSGKNNYSRDTKTSITIRTMFHRHQRKKHTSALNVLEHSVTREILFATWPFTIPNRLNRKRLWLWR